MNDKDHEFLVDAMRMHDAAITQCMRFQRKVTEFFKQPNAMTRADLEFEIKTLRGMFKNDGS